MLYIYHLVTNIVTNKEILNMKSNVLTMRDYIPNSHKEFIPDQDEYIKVYKNAIASLNDVTGKDRDVMDCILMLTDGMGNFASTAYNRSIISEMTGQSAQQVKNAISRLCTHKDEPTGLPNHRQSLLIKKDRGTYIPNPNFYGIGNWKDIVERRKDISLRLSVSKKSGGLVSFSLESKDHE